MSKTKQLDNEELKNVVGGTMPNYFGKVKESTIYVNLLDANELVYVSKVLIVGIANGVTVGNVTYSNAIKVDSNKYRIESSSYTVNVSNFINTYDIDNPITNFQKTIH